MGSPASSCQLHEAHHDPGEARERDAGAVIRRSAVGSRPKRRSAGYSTRLLNGMRIITSAGLSACICEGSNHVRLGHGVGLQHPGGRLLVEQRPERRDQREEHEQAQHRAHAVDRLVRVAAAGAIELQRHADAAERQHRARARCTAPRRTPSARDERQGRHGPQQAEPGQHEPPRPCLRRARAGRCAPRHEPVRIAARRGGTFT
jgi:hypothetical protein